MFRKCVGVFLIASVALPVIALVACVVWEVIAGDWENAIPAGAILWLLAIAAAFTYYVATDECSDVW
jgi:hypothetical protein